MLLFPHNWQTLLKLEVYESNGEVEGDLVLNLSFELPPDTRSLKALAFEFEGSQTIEALSYFQNGVFIADHPLSLTQNGTYKRSADEKSIYLEVKMSPTYERSIGLTYEKYVKMMRQFDIESVENGPIYIGISEVTLE